MRKTMSVGPVPAEAGCRSTAKEGPEMGRTVILVEKLAKMFTFYPFRRPVDAK